MLSYNFNLKYAYVITADTSVVAQILKHIFASFLHTCIQILHDQQKCSKNILFSGKD